MLIFLFLMGFYWCVEILVDYWSEAESMDFRICILFWPIFICSSEKDSITLHDGIISRICRKQLIYSNAIVVYWLVLSPSEHKVEGLSPLRV